MALPSYNTIVLGALVLLLLVWAIYNEVRLRKLTRGNNGKSLEDALGKTFSIAKSIQEENKEIKDHIEVIHNRLRKTIRNVETIRFNPFPDQGGNQSFATAFLNDEGNGVVFSSLYSREKTSVFAKPIKKLSSEYELTEEEKRVIDQAKVK